MSRRPRLTPEQKQARYDAVKDLYIRFVSTSEICETVGKRFEIGPRAVSFILHDVREDLRKAGFELKPPELRIERERCLRFMQQVASDASIAGHHAAAAKAGREVGLMIGLYAADRLEISGPGGGPLPISVDAARDRVQQKLEKIAKR